MSSTVARFITTLPVAAALPKGTVADLLRRALEKHGAERDALCKRIEHIMMTTSSFALRNEAALAILHLGQKEVRLSLEDLLRRPEVAKSAGTLVYVADELGLAISLDAIINITEHGSYEARATMIGLVEDGRWESDPDQDIHASHLHRLSQLSEGIDEDAREVATIVLARLARS